MAQGIDEVDPPRSRVLVRRFHVPVAIQVTALSGAAAAVQGLLGILLAKWLGAHDRGVLAIAQTLVSLIVLLLSLGIVSSARIILSTPQWGLTLRSYVRATRGILLLDLVVSVVAALTLFPWLSRVTDVYLAAGFVVMSLAQLRSGLLREGMQGVGRHRTAFLGEFLGPACSLVVLTALWWTGTLDLRTGMLAIVARVVLQYLFQWLNTVRCLGADPGTPIEPGLLRRIVRFSLPGLVIGIGASISSQVDRLLLGAFDGPAPVGVYASAATLSILAGTLPSAVSPMIVRQVALHSDPTLHRRWWRKAMLGSLALCGVILALGAVLLEFYLGQEFSGSTVILGILLLGALAMTSQQVDNAVNNGLGDLKAGATSALVGVPVGLLAYLVLIPPFGMVGCAVGNVCSYLAMAVTARVLLRRRLARTASDG